MNNFMRQNHIRILRVLGLLVSVSAMITACGPSAEEQITMTAVSNLAIVDSWTKTPTLTFTPTLTLTPTLTATATHTLTPSRTVTPSITPSPTISLTPTYAFPTINVKMQAHCRYGPGTAYLHAADLYIGDTGQIWGRDYSSSWLWIQPDKIHYQCWVSASVVDVDGDISVLRVAPVRLPKSTLYSQPKDVAATRDGNLVTVSWNPINMTVDDDRGYMLEVNICRDGYIIWQVVHTNRSTYTFTDQSGCGGGSSALLYAVEKHGYVDPVSVPWPQEK